MAENARVHVYDFFSTFRCVAQTANVEIRIGSTTTPQIGQVSSRQQSYRNYIIRNVTGPIVCRMDRTCVPRSMLRFSLYGVTLRQKCTRNLQPRFLLNFVLV